jgi:hypothetical protein
MGGILAVVLLASGYAFGASFAVAVGLAALEMAILAAIAVLLASGTSPVLAGLLTLAAWIIGHGSSDLQVLLATETAPALQGAVRVVFWFVPRLDLYADIAPVLAGSPYPPVQVALAAAYAAVYVAAALVVAAVVLARREFPL